MHYVNYNYLILNLKAVFVDNVWAKTIMLSNGHSCISIDGPAEREY